MMQDESYFAFYSFSSLGKENLSPISGAAVAGILPKQLRWKTFQLLWLDDVFAFWSSTTSKRQKLSCNLFHPREYFRPLARLKHSEILKWSNSWNRISDKTSTITKTIWTPPTCSQLSPQSEQECLENIHPLLVTESKPICMKASKRCCWEPHSFILPQNWNRIW